MLWQQAAMVRNSAGVGLRKQPNPGHFGQLRNPGQTHFCRSKKRKCPGKRGRMVTLMLHERMLAIDSAGLHLNFDWGNRQLWPKLTLLVSVYVLGYSKHNTTQPTCTLAHYIITYICNARSFYMRASQFLPRAGSLVLGFVARRTPTGSSADHNT